jgi:hypothetical protein
MTHNDLGILWLLAAVLAAGLVLTLRLLQQVQAARRRNSVLDRYAQRQIRLQSRKVRANRGVLPGRPAQVTRAI